AATRRGRRCARLLRGVAAPRRGRRIHRPGEIELDLELATTRAGEFVDKALSRLDLHRPGVGDRGRQAFALEQRNRFGVDREFLPLGGARDDALAAVHGHRVVAAVLVAVVVLEPQARAHAGEHPGAGTVVADVERHPQLACRVVAAAHVHHQPLGLERVGLGRARLVGHHPALEGLAAVRGQRGHECVGGHFGRGEALGGGVGLLGRIALAAGGVGRAVEADAAGQGKHEAAGGEDSEGRLHGGTVAAPGGACKCGPAARAQPYSASSSFSAASRSACSCTWRWPSVAARSGSDQVAGSASIASTSASACSSRATFASALPTRWGWGLPAGFAGAGGGTGSGARADAGARACSLAGRARSQAAYSSRSPSNGLTTPSDTRQKVSLTRPIRWRSCETSTIAPSKSESASASASRMSRSRWLVGSSGSSTLGCFQAISASARRARSPPEKPSMLSNARSPGKYHLPRKSRKAWVGASGESSRRWSIGELPALSDSTVCWAK